MWFSQRDLEAPGIRLFCLPHAGSGAAGFYRWKKLLPASISVCPVLLPGRESRLSEACFTSAAALVEEILQQAMKITTRPYAVFGHSMGALLAYEWVRRMEVSGLPEPLCLLVSGRNAPQVPASHGDLQCLQDSALVSELRKRYGGEPEALLADPELREVFLPILRSDLRVVESYRWSSGPKLSCEIRAMAGERDTSVSMAGLELWKEMTSADSEARRFVGDHFYSFGEGQTDLLQFIATTVETLSTGKRSLNREAG